MSTPTFTTCPACGQVAEIRDRFVLSSTDGPVEHVRMMCLLRHYFVLPTASLHREGAVSGPEQIAELADDRKLGVCYQPPTGRSSTVVRQAWLRG